MLSATVGSEKSVAWPGPHVLQLSTVNRAAEAGRLASLAQSNGECLLSFYAPLKLGGVISPRVDIALDWPNCGCTCTLCLPEMVI